MKKHILSLILCVGLFANCRKEAIKVDGNFEGFWKQYNAYVISEITIPHKGTAKHYTVVSGTPNTVEGKCKIDKKKNEMYIELHTFKINRYPYQETDTALST